MFKKHGYAFTAASVVVDARDPGARLQLKVSDAAVLVDARIALVAIVEEVRVKQRIGADNLPVGEPLRGFDRGRRRKTAAQVDHYGVASERRPWSCGKVLVDRFVPAWRGDGCNAAAPGAGQESFRHRQAIGSPR